MVITTDEAAVELNQRYRETEGRPTLSFPAQDPTPGFVPRLKWQDI
jgi:ssRNA-specific RNase YbeY (16S rRNA maturation enzyme)